MVKNDRVEGVVIILRMPIERHRGISALDAVLYLMILDTLLKYLLVNLFK